MPDRMYDYDQPDALDLPWDSEAADGSCPIAGRITATVRFNPAEREPDVTGRR